MVKQPRKLSPAQVEALDHDDNGSAGGSKPRDSHEAAREGPAEELSKVSGGPSRAPEPDPEETPRRDDAFYRLRLPPHEFEGICAEAYEAYDFQGERIRFDSLGRKWTFRPDKVGQGASVLSLEVRLLDSCRLDTISTAVLASDLGRDMVADVVKAMDEELK